MTLVELCEKFSAGEVDALEAKKIAETLEPPKKVYEDDYNLYTGDFWYEGEMDNSVDAVYANVGETYSFEQAKKFVEEVVA